MVILDVREKEEFQLESIPDSICCPLSQFDMMAPGILKNIKDSDVVIMCRTGNRAKIALETIKKMDFNQHTFSCYEGGILKWKEEGNKVISTKSSLPLMRQVQIIAGGLIVLSFVASSLWAQAFIFLALFVGVGLMFAGIMGVCPMMSILKKMPWNKASTICKKEKCHAC